MKVTINGEEYEFSFDSVWGPIYLYEEVTGGQLPFDPSKTLCLHVLYWCILSRANGARWTVGLDAFLQSLNDMELVRRMTAYYRERMEVLTTGVPAAENGTAASAGDAKKKG